MPSLILAVTLLILALLVVVLRKTYAMVPTHELKRQAADGNVLAQKLYEAVGYGSSLRLLLWMVLIAASAGGFVLLTLNAPALISMLVIIVVLWLAFSWIPSTRVTSINVRITQKVTPTVVWLLHLLDPLLQRIVGLLTRRYKPRHSGLYELNDLLNLLDLQSKQEDSRITSEEITLIRQVLKFGDYKVRDVFRARQGIKSVALTDAIGPVLLDELHASGQTSFPVKKTPRSKEIVAALHIGDVGIHSTGTVEDYVTQGVTYIHESDSLADALHVFYQTKRQLFVVINSFEEYVGVLMLEDILQTLVGFSAANETLGSHDDGGSVAARHPRSKAKTVVE